MLTKDFVKADTGLSDVTLWRKARDPNDPFPAPVQISANRIGWREDEYEQWRESLPRVNYAPGTPEAA